MTHDGGHSHSGKTGLVIFIVIVAAALGIAALSLAGTKTTVRRTRSDKKHISSEYVAVLSVTGVIMEDGSEYNQDWLLDTVDMLKQDKKNRGIFLYVDSPGGSVYETDEAFLALRDYAAAKPVRAHFGRIAASGGYYIACAASRISANRNTLTGSIGVIAGQSVDLTELMEHFGVKVTTITAGSNKNMFGFDSPLTSEQRAIMQSLADECYDQFVGIVAAARGMTDGEVRKIADGRIYTAKQALGIRLIDEIASYDDALDGFIAEISDSSSTKKVEPKTFEYEPKQRLSEWLSKKAALTLCSATGITSLDTVFEKIAPGISFPAYYCQR